MQKKNNQTFISMVFLSLREDAYSFNGSILRDGDKDANIIGFALAMLSTLSAIAAFIAVSVLWASSVLALGAGAAFGIAVASLIGGGIGGFIAAGLLVGFIKNLECMLGVAIDLVLLPVAIVADVLDIISRGSLSKIWNGISGAIENLLKKYADAEKTQDEAYTQLLPHNDDMLSNSEFPTTSASYGAPLVPEKRSETRDQNSTEQTASTTTSNHHGVRPSNCG
ncbi:MAG: hypothetical protein DHS20C10_09920 [marine bacterium B5-7]|nr:MAG: hypothetical protein DHS20C10_09920 [marine bacterium B5-7]